MRALYDQRSDRSRFAVLAVTSHNTHTRLTYISHRPTRVATSHEAGNVILAIAQATALARQFANLCLCLLTELAATATPEFLRRSETGLTVLFFSPADWRVSP